MKLTSSIDRAIVRERGGHPQKYRYRGHKRAHQAQVGRGHCSIEAISTIEQTKEGWKRKVKKGAP